MRLLYSLLLASFVLLAPDIARADDAEDLWRVCVHESSLPSWQHLRDGSGEMGWVNQRTGEAWGGDCFGIHEVFLRGAERTEHSYRQFARDYSGRVFEPLTYEEHELAVARGADGLAQNRWASFLRTDGHEPTGWPSAHRRWGSEHGGRAAAMMALELCRFIATRTLEDIATWSIAEHPVDDWGGRMDGDHATDIGLVLVGTTVPTANSFYARPALIAARSAIASR